MGRPFSSLEKLPGFEVDGRVTIVEQYKTIFKFYCAAMLRPDICYAESRYFSRRPACLKEHGTAPRRRVCISSIAVREGTEGAFAANRGGAEELVWREATEILE